MKRQIQILLSLLLANASCLFGQRHMSATNPYLNKNYNPNLHTDGMTPKRLDNLKGNIKTMSVFEYEVNEDSTKGRMTQGTPTFTLLFDNQKNIREEWGYRDTKQVASKTYFRDFRKYTRDSVIFYNSPANQPYREYYFFDPNGILIKQKELRDTQIKETEYPLTKQAGALYHLSQWGSTKYIAGNMVESRDAKGNLLETKTYHPGGGLASTTGYKNKVLCNIEKFDKNSRLIFYQFNYIEDNNTIAESRTRELTYDNNGLKIAEKETEKSPGRVSITNWKYVYKNGRIASVYRDNQLIGTYEYNQYGDLVKVVYEYDTEIFSYPTRDKTGNWTTQISYLHGKPFRITEREFEYFPLGK